MNTYKEVMQASMADRKRMQAKDNGNRVVRDSFSMVREDYELIAVLRQRCLRLGFNVNKSQVLRAALHSLDKASDRNLTKLVEGLSKVKTGRPK